MKPLERISGNLVLVRFCTARSMIGPRWLSGHWAPTSSTAYGCVCTYAEMLGYDEAHELLGQNLDEEEATDERLTALAESVINVAAAEGTEEETSR